MKSELRQHHSKLSVVEQNVMRCLKKETTSGIHRIYVELVLREAKLP